MEVEFPIPSQPMLIVYWARWANSIGEVGRWSKTCVARVEGWTATPALSAQEQMAIEGSRVETKLVIVQAAQQLPGEVEHDDEFELDRLLPALIERAALPGIPLRP